MPFEEMAKRGRKTLLFGPMKPVGLEKDGVRPFAVVQLRQDNKEASLYNIVGFQTNLKWGEQKRVFSMIPGLLNAEFVRYGVMHRNTYIDAPRVINRFYQMKNYKNIFFHVFHIHLRKLQEKLLLFLSTFTKTFDGLIFWLIFF